MDSNIKNTNQYVIIYPTPEGWKKMRENIILAWSHPLLKRHLDQKLEEFEKGKTEDGGFKEQLWEIISGHHNMFFIGSPYLENTNMVFPE